MTSGNRKSYGSARNFQHPAQILKLTHYPKSQELWKCSKLPTRPPSKSHARLSVIARAMEVLETSNAVETVTVSTLWLRVQAPRGTPGCRAPSPGAGPPRSPRAGHRPDCPRGASPLQLRTPGAPMWGSWLGRTRACRRRPRKCICRAPWARGHPLGSYRVRCGGRAGEASAAPRALQGKARGGKQLSKRPERALLAHRRWPGSTGGLGLCFRGLRGLGLASKKVCHANERTAGALQEPGKSVDRE
jgi:hypothetical protein